MIQRSDIRLKTRNCVKGKKFLNYRQKSRNKISHISPASELDVLCNDTLVRDGAIPRASLGM